MAHRAHSCLQLLQRMRVLASTTYKIGASWRTKNATYSPTADIVLASGTQGLNGWRTGPEDGTQGPKQESKKGVHWTLSLLESGVERYFPVCCPGEQTTHN